MDAKILSFLNNAGQLVPDWLNKFLAEYLVYSLPLLLLVFWFWGNKTKKAALRAGLSVILAWPVLAVLIGKTVNRPRPFELGGIREVFFHRPDYSFPSDHASALFAVAFSFVFSGNKKLGWSVFALGIIVSVFRVAAGVHWPSDILAGLIIGLLSAYLVNLFDKPLDIFYNFVLKIARFLKLA